MLIPVICLEALLIMVYWKPVRKLCAFIYICWSATNSFQKCIDMLNAVSWQSYVRNALCTMGFSMSSAGNYFLNLHLSSI